MFYVPESVLCDATDEFLVESYCNVSFNQDLILDRRPHYPMFVLDRAISTIHPGRVDK